jgi:hypothetical protein
MAKDQRNMSAAEIKAAEEAEERNRKATGGYDQTKGPSGKGEHKTKVVAMPDDDIRDEFTKIIKSFQGRADKQQVVSALRTAAELLYRDESWVRDPATLDYDPDDLDDPRANPMGLRPSPAKATRADEHTAPEPDSMGNSADRAAARAGINEEEDDLTDVPPADRDAVATKRAAERSAEQFGTAGGTPLSRAEHKDDPKPKKK